MGNGPVMGRAKVGTLPFAQCFCLGARKGGCAISPPVMVCTGGGGSAHPLCASVHTGWRICPSSLFKEDSAHAVLRIPP